MGKIQANLTSAIFFLLTQSPLCEFTTATTSYTYTYYKRIFVKTHLDLFWVLQKKKKCFSFSFVVISLFWLSHIMHKAYTELGG